jgi:hypothetical protein
MSMDKDTTRTATGMPVAATPQRPDDASVYTAPPQPVVPTPVVAANQPPKRRGSRVLDIALALAAVLAIGGVAFAVGRATAPAPAQAARGFDGNGAFFRNGGSFDPNAGGANGGGPRFAFGGGGALAIDGTVTAVSADSITIKRADGQEMTFDLSGTTAYHQATTAAASDVAVGDNVSVRVTAGGRLGGGGGQNGGQNGGQGGATASGAPTLSASDVTVTH